MNSAQAIIDEAGATGRPVRFPRPDRPAPPNAVRVPALADIAGLLAWAFPIILQQYPRAQLGPVRQLLASCTSARAGDGMRLLRTDNALGLFVAARDVFEPAWTITTKFVVHDDAPDEAGRIVEVARQWARTLGAITFDGRPLKK